MRHTVLRVLSAAIMLVLLSTSVASAGVSRPDAHALLRHALLSMANTLRTVHLVTSGDTRGDCVSRGTELAAHFWLPHGSAPEQVIAIQGHSVDTWELSSETGGVWKHVEFAGIVPLLAMCPTSDSFASVALRILTGPCSVGTCRYGPLRVVGREHLRGYPVWHLRETRTEQNGATFAWLRESQDIFLDVRTLNLVRLSYTRTSQATGALPGSMSQVIDYSQFNAPLSIVAPASL